MVKNASVEWFKPDSEVQGRVDHVAPIKTSNEMLIEREVWPLDAAEAGVKIVPHGMDDTGI